MLKWSNLEQLKNPKILFIIKKFLDSQKFQNFFIFVVLVHKKI